MTDRTGKAVNVYGAVDVNDYLARAMRKNLNSFTHNSATPLTRPHGPSKSLTASSSSSSDPRNKATPTPSKVKQSEIALEMPSAASAASSTYSKFSLSDVVPTAPANDSVAFSTGTSPVDHIAAHQFSKWMVDNCPPGHPLPKEDRQLSDEQPFQSPHPAGLRAPPCTPASPTREVGRIHQDVLEDRPPDSTSGDRKYAPRRKSLLSGSPVSTQASIDSHDYTSFYTPHKTLTDKERRRQDESFTQMSVSMAKEPLRPSIMAGLQPTSGLEASVWAPSNRGKSGTVPEKTLRIDTTLKGAFSTPVSSFPALAASFKTGTSLQNVQFSKESEKLPRSNEITTPPHHPPSNLSGAAAAWVPPHLRAAITSTKENENELAETLRLPEAFQSLEIHADGNPEIFATATSGKIGPKEASNRVDSQTAQNLHQEKGMSQGESAMPISARGEYIAPHLRDHKKLPALAVHAANRSPSRHSRQPLQIISPAVPQASSTSPKDVQTAASTAASTSPYIERAKLGDSCISHETGTAPTSVTGSFGSLTPSSVNFTLASPKTVESMGIKVAKGTEDEEENLEGVLYFKAWPKLQKRDGPGGAALRHPIHILSPTFVSRLQTLHLYSPRAAARIRTCIITGLPHKSSPTFVQAHVFHGALESISIESSLAKVRFLNADDCQQYYNATSNGLPFKGRDGKELFANVELGKDVDVVGGLLRDWMKKGITRCVRAIGVEKGYSRKKLYEVAENKGRRALEAIIDSENDKGTRLVVFRFMNVEDSQTFKSALVRNEEFEMCNVQFYADPCATARGIHLGDTAT